MTSYFTHAARRMSTALLAFTVAGTSACNSLLDVENPGRVPSTSLSDPALMQSLKERRAAGESKPADEEEG